jgi:hypothetical protein
MFYGSFTGRLASMLAALFDSTELTAANNNTGSPGGTIGKIAGAVGNAIGVSPNSITPPNLGTVLGHGLDQITKGHLP